MAGTIEIESRWQISKHRLWGRSLRFVLVDELQRRGTMTVAEMVALIAEHGFVLSGRASKVISDSLRWEVARGRVVRTARGAYQYGRTPSTTGRRISLFARYCLAWAAATALDETPPPTPATPPYRNWKRKVEDPLRPPWFNTAWLWST